MVGQSLMVVFVAVVVVVVGVGDIVLVRLCFSFYLLGWGGSKVLFVFMSCFGVDRC